MSWGVASFEVGDEKWLYNRFCFFASGFGFYCCFLSWYHLPCICNSWELEPLILHGICYILVGHFAFCMVLATFGHVRLPFCMIFATLWRFSFSCAWYLLHFGTSNVHVGFWKVLQGFFRVSFKVRCRVSFRVSVGFL